jgi:FdhD protein
VDGAPTRNVPCRRYRHQRVRDITDEVAREIAITVRLDGGGPKRLYASPRDLESLALGHAALEMASPGTVPEISRIDGYEYDLVSRPVAAVPWDASLPRPLAAGDVLDRMRQFIAAPGLWDDTGCFHRAALFDPESGAFVARAEDIGRHNCLDRLAGQGVRQGLRLSALLLFLSCRVTASMMDKAVRAGLHLIVSRSAVTDAAIEAARQSGVTLVGFARDAEDRLTIFCDGPGRVRP